MTVRTHILGRTLAVLFVLVTLGWPAMAQAQTQRATGKPTALRVTVTKVELYNGTSWISLFTGTAELDMVAGGSFPGISNLTLAPGTYSRMRVTVVNAFGVTGSLSYSGTTYYVTANNGPGGAGTAAATTTAGSAGQYTFSNPAWGATGASYLLPEFTIGPIVVTASTSYQPTLKFDVTTALQLLEAPGPSWYFVLGVPVVTIV